MKVNFEKHLVRGERSYDTRIGDWWLKKSEDLAHRKAYEDIAKRIASWCTIPPEFLVDYAGASGALIRRLAPLLPKTRFVTLDGSRKMLKFGFQQISMSGLDVDFVLPAKAFSRRGPRIRLVHTPLPWDDAPCGVADAAVLLFPNLNSTTHRQNLARRNWIRDKSVESVAHLFSLVLHEQSKKKHNSALAFEELILQRAVSENIRHMLKSGGLWFKADYANARRQQLDKVDDWKMLFAESAIDLKIGDLKTTGSFRLIENLYFKSGVIRDVYDQTRDPDDKTGGYILSIFRTLSK
jgi:hypothetical protein